ncbi:hypothetical protein RB195_003962 [Necator americanus]|uniref:Uncharacterized protein n=1 Tax=Necator americanus TaxID=51031 RepID=A0ABR1DTQ8_NECAM
MERGSEFCPVIQGMEYELELADGYDEIHSIPSLLRCFSERGVDFGSMQGPVQENRTLQGSFLGDGDMTTANANNSFTAVAVETETILKVKRNAKEPA